MKLALLLAVCLAAPFATAQSLTGLPVPPPGATVFTQLEQMSGWSSCHDSGCAGGSGKGTYWMAQNQSSLRFRAPAPKSSTRVCGPMPCGGKNWAQQQRHQSAVGFLRAVGFQRRSGAQALEYDSFQFVGGYNYMVGSQCNVAAGVWDIWDELNGHWIHTSIACHGFPPTPGITSSGT